MKCIEYIYIYNISIWFFLTTQNHFECACVLMDMLQPESPIAMTIVVGFDGAFHNRPLAGGNSVPKHNLVCEFFPRFRDNCLGFKVRTSSNEFVPKKIKKNCLSCWKRQRAAQISLKVWKRLRQDPQPVFVAWLGAPTGECASWNGNPEKCSAWFVVVPKTYQKLPKKALFISFVETENKIETLKNMNIL